jgi:hypothetical protein
MAKKRCGVDAAGAFLNVDLDVYSPRSLESLVAELGKAVIVMAAGREGARYAAHLELVASRYGQSADRIITRFVGLINRLSADARAAWDLASARTFDVGIQSGCETSQFQMLLKRTTVVAMAGVGAGLAITVYSCPHAKQSGKAMRNSDFAAYVHF